MEEFYKNDNFAINVSQSEFGGPYIVLPGMLEYIIENGKLRVDTIKTFHFLLNDYITDINELGEMNSLKAFCALFLGKQIQIPDGLNNNLMVKKFTLKETTMHIQNNLEAILAIDAVELEISFQNVNTIIDCSQYNNSSIIAQNTTKITVHFEFDFQSSKEDIEKFATNFEIFCSFLVRACPALKHLHITIQSSLLNLIDSSIEEFTNNFHSTIKSIEANIKSINIGNEHLQISIELSARIPRHILNELPFQLQSHAVFKFGSPFSLLGFDENEYIAHSLECVDVCGRIHELLFKIFGTDFYDYDFDDFRSDYYGYDYNDW